MKVNTFAKALAAGLGTVAVTLAAAGAPAAANPVGAPTFRDVVAVGSDTTYEMMNGLSNRLRLNGDAANPLALASYDPTPVGEMIQTRSTGCTFPRPNGSGQGKAALLASEGGSGGIWSGFNVLGCVDVARSSSGPSSLTTSGSLAYASFGVDAVSYAQTATSDLPASMTLVQLQRVYRCLTTVIAGTPIQPRLIQAGSGTRSYWNGKMGITDIEIGNHDYPCLEAQPTVQEHSGNVLNGHPDQIVPLSIAQYISQGNHASIDATYGVTLDDRRGEAVLGKINNVSPYAADGVSLNTTFPFNRDVYNVIPTAKLSNPLIANLFVGATSQVCNNQALIKAFGFGFRPSTGSQPANLAQQGCGDVYLKGNN